jgi:hypothetical protein
MKVNGKLPQGDADGLSSLEAIVLKKRQPVVVMMILEPTHVDQDLTSGQQTVRMGIRRVEPVLQDDIEAATRLIQRSFESRTGDSTLPIELENDVKEALKGVDTYIPETPVDEEVIVPEGGYVKMNIDALQKLLKKRGLDHRKATKTELISRLEAADGDDTAPPSNVTAMFQDGSNFVPPVDDGDVDEDRDPEVPSYAQGPVDTSIPDADDEAWDAAAPEIPAPAEGEYIDDPDDERDE